MKCPECDTPQPDDAAICSKCGLSFEVWREMNPIEASVQGEEMAFPEAPDDGPPARGPEAQAPDPATPVEPQKIKTARAKVPKKIPKAVPWGVGIGVAALLVLVMLLERHPPSSDPGQAATVPSPTVGPAFTPTSTGPVLTPARSPLASVPSPTATRVPAAPSPTHTALPKPTATPVPAVTDIPVEDEEEPTATVPAGKVAPAAGSGDLLENSEPLSGTGAVPSPSQAPSTP